MKVLLIDNYDSFTYNLAQSLRVLGADVEVWRNDRLSVAEARAREPQRLVISPGPGRPEAAGISVALIRELAGRVPILGVCLGHQAIAAAFGGTIGRAGRLMHGKTSAVEHDGEGVFRGMPMPLEVGRYHSLAVDALPDCFTVTARSEDGEIMGMRHRDAPIEGVQFHPESVLTPRGDELLQNFLANGAGPGS